jgi:hypothetical protein
VPRLETLLSVKGLFVTLTYAALNLQAAAKLQVPASYTTHITFEANGKDETGAGREKKLLSWCLVFLTMLYQPIWLYSVNVGGRGILSVCLVSNDDRSAGQDK